MPALDAIADAVREIWRETDDRPIPEWAGDNVELPNSVASPGPFSIENSRHFELPFECLKSDEVREVNICAPPRSGKSLIADVFLPWCVVNDPGPFRWTFHNDQIAHGHMIKRVRPMLENSPATRDIMRGIHPDLKTKKGVIFPQMPFEIGGPAVGQLQGYAVCYMILDEPWLYAPGRIAEARGRLGDFLRMGRSKLLCIGQGGSIDTDWDRQWKTGYYLPWLVVCPECHESFWSKFTGYRDDDTTWGLKFEYEKDEVGRRRLADPESIHYECPSCRTKLRDETAVKRYWNEHGSYPRPDRLPEVVSIRWNNLIDFPWKALVQLFLNARNASTLSGDEADIIAFVQKQLTRMYNPADVIDRPTLPSVDLADAGADGRWWVHQDFLCMTVDVQQDHEWWMVEAWSSDGQRMVIDFGQAFGWDDLLDIQNRYGVKVVGIDCPHKYSEVIYQCWKNNWWPMRGSGEDGFRNIVGKGKSAKRILSPVKNPPEIVEVGTGLQKADKRFQEVQAARRSGRKPTVKLMWWSNPYIKSVMMNHRAMMEKGRRAFLSKKAAASVLPIHLYSERRVVDNKGGKKRFTFQQIGAKPNHGWDCWGMSTALAWYAGKVKEEEPPTEPEKGEE